MSNGTDPDTEKFKLLFDYTKFHIGVYLTFTAAMATILAADQNTFFGSIVFNPVMIFFAAASMVIAGMSGGIIVSSLCDPNCRSREKGVDHSFESFWEDQDLGPLDSEWFKTKKWARIEHVSFWIAVGFAFLSIVEWDGVFAFFTDLY